MDHVIEGGVFSAPTIQAIATSRVRVKKAVIAAITGSLYVSMAGFRLVFDLDVGAIFARRYLSTAEQEPATGRRKSRPLCSSCVGRKGVEVYTVELYRKVCLACADGMSNHAAAAHFNISRDTVEKALAFSVPPGYR